MTLFDRNIHISIRVGNTAAKVRVAGVVEVGPEVPASIRVGSEIYFAADKALSVDGWPTPEAIIDSFDVLGVK